MKHLLLAISLLSGLCAIAQDERITIQGKIVDARGNPVPDVYVINMTSNEKDITLNNGVFTIKIFPTDSLVLSHISYYRKIITANTLLFNPLVTLESESINVEEVRVSPEQKTDADNALENIQEIDWDPRPKVDDGFSDADRVSQTMTENNRVMRTEASSVTFLRFSPGDIFAKWKKKRQRRKSRR